MTERRPGRIADRVDVQPRDIACRIVPLEALRGTARRLNEPHGRIWKAIQGLAPADASEQPVAVKNSTTRKKAPAARKRAGGHSKAARVIAMLERPEGATLHAIMRATGWQTHSVRGFISGHLKKKLGLKVRSSKREGERVYSIRRKS